MADKGASNGLASIFQLTVFHMICHRLDTMHGKKLSLEKNETILANKHAICILWNQLYNYCAH